MLQLFVFHVTQLIAYILRPTSLTELGSVLKLNAEKKVKLLLGNTASGILIVSIVKLVIYYVDLSKSYLSWNIEFGKICFLLKESSNTKDHLMCL